MGFFSQLALEQAAHRNMLPDHSYMTPQIVLELELDDLRARLAAMTALRPQDKASAEYDRWFYGDREVSAPSYPESVQELLHAIHATESRIQAEKDRLFRELSLRISVFNTGADKAGQLVIVEVFSLAAIAMAAKQERSIL